MVKQNLSINIPEFHTSIMIQQNSLLQLVPFTSLPLNLNFLNTMLVNHSADISAQQCITYTGRGIPNFPPSITISYTDAVAEGCFET
jgi:hypothetical protein